MSPEIKDSQFEYSDALESKKEAEKDLAELLAEIDEWEKELQSNQTQLGRYRQLRSEIDTLSREPESEDYLIKTIQQMMSFLEDQIKSFQEQVAFFRSSIEKFQSLHEKGRELLLSVKTTGEH